MGIRELRNIYGDVKIIQAMNRAVRAEIPGGRLFYDALSLASKKQNESPDSQELYRKLEAMRQEMFDFIAKKYEFKTVGEKINE